MAINKKLIHFQTREAFNTQLESNNILDTSIVFIKDTQEIWTHGQFYPASIIGEIEGTAYDGAKGKANADNIAKINSISDNMMKDIAEIQNTLYLPYKAVDLGLPSGILWADRNIGASSPEDSGLYFQWGDTQGYTADQCGSGEGQKAFTWDDYKFGTESNLTKYNDTDGKTVLDSEDDAVSVTSVKFRMPTEAEMEELWALPKKWVVASRADVNDSWGEPEEFDSMEAANIQENDMKFDDYGNLIQDESLKKFLGVKFIGMNGNSIFVPAAGACGYSVSVGCNNEGQLWSSSQSIRASEAKIGGFDVSGNWGVGNADRHLGFRVRGVTTSTKKVSILDNKVDKKEGKDLSSNDFTDDFKTKLEGIEAGAQVNTVTSVAGRIGAVTLTKADVGLRNVDNTSDANKPVSTAQAAAIKVVQDDITAHKGNKANPHEVTKAQVGLGNVTNDVQVKRSEMGVANGVATLDANGKVPSSQLPSYVDDIIDVYATYSKSDTGVLSNIILYSDAAKTQLVTGETGKIYQNVIIGEPAYQFRWTGTVFAQTGANSIIIGEVSGTAYDGAKGKANADNIAEIQNTLYSLYKVVDLGLPSGTLWADRNIGATNIYDGGKLFQWGDPTPYDIPEHTNGKINEGQKMFNWSDYKWSRYGRDTMTKYNNTDGKSTLDLEDDAAHVNMGNAWKMPTKEQVIELFTGTTQELYAKLMDDSDPVKVANGVYNENDGHVSWTYIDEHASYEVSGKLVYIVLTSKTNGNFLVVPSSVYAHSGRVNPVGSSGQFWSSSLYSRYVNAAWNGYFNTDYYGVNDNDQRCVGMGVRGVTTSTKKVSILDTKVDKEEGKGLSSNDYTNDEKTKLSGIEAGAQVNTVTSVAGKTGAVALNKGDVGLGNVDNTSDANKPISTAQSQKFSEIELKLNKLHGSVIALTQSQYNALTTKDSETLYIVD